MKFHCKHCKQGDALALCRRVLGLEAATGGEGEK